MEYKKSFFKECFEYEDERELCRGGVNLHKEPWSFTQKI